MSVAQYPHISLEQWRALVAVIESGGYAQAALALHKSQSSITYAVQKIESLLELEVFEMRGRKAELTGAGQVLYRRARTLLDEALALERGAGAMAEGWQPEIGIAAEIIFPTWLMLDCLAEFMAERPETRVEFHETVLGGTQEAITAGRVDLAICSVVPEGFIGEPLIHLTAIAVAHPGHPLHQLNRPITRRDLKRHRHLYIRDSKSGRDASDVRAGAERRLTVSNKATFLRALTMGLGYAWFTEDAIREELAAGTLKPLPLAEGGGKVAPLYLVFADPEFASRDTHRLAGIIKQHIAHDCRHRGHQ